MGSPITWCRPPRCHSDLARRCPSGRIRWAQLRANSLRGWRLGGFAAQRAAGKTAPTGRPADRIPSRRFGAQANAPARRRFALAVEAKAEDGEEGFRSRIVAASFCNAAYPRLKGTGSRLGPRLGARPVGAVVFPVLSLSSGIPPLLRRLWRASARGWGEAPRNKKP